MSKKHFSVRVLMHRAFAVFLTLFLISDVRSVYAFKNLQIIAQKGESSQSDATRAEALKLSQEGLQLFKQGSKESLVAARNKFKKALVLWQKLGDKKLQATILTIIGRIYSNLGEKQKALQYYNQALPLRRAVGDKGGEAITLSNIGGVYSDLGEKQKALQYLNQALPLIRAAGDKPGEAKILYGIGFLYLGLAKKQKVVVDWYSKKEHKALQHFNQALTLYRELGDKRGETTTLNAIGGVYTSLGENRRALQFYKQANPSFFPTTVEKRGEEAKVEKIGVEANSFIGIGGLHYPLREKQKALQNYNQALLSYRAMGNRDREAFTLNNIGQVYLSLGEKQKALQYFNQTLLLRRQVGDKRGEAFTLNNIGSVYLSLGEKQKTLQYLKQALLLRRQVGDKRGEAYTLDAIGSIYISLGENQNALQYLNQALSLSRAVGDKSGEANALSLIGVAYSILGEKQKGMQLVKQSFLLEIATGERQPTLSYGKLADLERKRGNLQLSLMYIKSAIAIIEGLRGNYTDQDLKTTYFSTVQGYYKFYIHLLMDLHKKNPSKRYDAQALHISERSRARSLIELLAQANAKISKNVDPKLIAQEQELQLKRQNQEKILAKLINSSQPPKGSIKKTEAQIQNIINQQKQLRVKIRAQNPQRDKLTNPEPLKLPQIQQQLDKDTVLLQYSLGKERSYLWLVTPTSLNTYELPPGEQIEKIAKIFHTDLAQRTTGDLAIESAQKLSKILLAPLKDKLTGKRLVIVADGVLQQIPFAALADPNTTTNTGKNNKYQPLLLNHEIVNLPSASTIAIQRENIGDRQPAAKKIAILADPVYSSKDKRVIGKVAATPPELELERSALQRSAKSLKRQSWSRLPFTAKEAEGILKLVSSESSLPALNFDANYNLATSKNLNQYQILHFATHGFVNPTHPELSGIVLSLVNKDGKQIPGYLRLADLFDQDYPAELIVLSACETGLGKNVSGEGLVGLTRGLMYAGASRVALSLWQVDDFGTSVLMQEFYRQMLQENKTPPQALRAAQHKLLSNPEWQSPYYWAAFILQGEWK